MPFFVTHLDGAMDADPPLSALPDLLDELAGADEEHPDVAVSDESGWTLSAFRDGRVVWENVEADDAPRQMEGLDRDRLLSLFEALARGDIATVEAAPWEPGG